MDRQMLEREHAELRNTIQLLELVQMRLAGQHITDSNHIAVALDRVYGAKVEVAKRFDVVDAELVASKAVRS